MTVAEMLPKTSDDDNDLITDNLDDCNFGDMGWISTPATDHDSDGCNDVTEDDDDDNDGLTRLTRTSVRNWRHRMGMPVTGPRFTAALTHDGDGCRDATEETLTTTVTGIPDSIDMMPERPDSLLAANRFDDAPKATQTMTAMAVMDQWHAPCGYEEDFDDDDDGVLRRR